MTPIEKMLRTLTDELSAVVRECEGPLITVDHAVLLNRHRALLDVLERLARTVAQHPAAITTIEWRELTPVEGAKRMIWLENRPLKASEIIDGLTARGWQPRSTKTPNATLCADLEHAKLH